MKCQENGVHRSDLCALRVRRGDAVPVLRCFYRVQWKLLSLGAKAVCAVFVSI
jgi:hypothetical protein